MRSRALSIGCLWIGLMLLPGTAVAAGPGVIFGRVTPVAIAPEVEVCMVEARAPETCSSPAADGTYSLPGLPVGVPLKIEFIPSHRSHYLPQFYDHASSLAAATEIIVTAPPARPLEEIDADLELGGTIEGTVTAASGGAPLGEVEVCVIDAGTRVSHGCTETDGAGGYALAGLAPGSYEVGFWGQGESAEYAPRYYDEATTIAGATPVAAAAGATVAGVDASMVKGAHVEGTVTAAGGGSTLADIPVCLFAATSSRPTECTYSLPGGTYSLVGIASGSYQVGFSLGSAEIGGETVTSEDDGYLTQYYDEVPSRAEAATLLLSADQVVSGIDAHLTGPPPPAAPASPLAVTSPLVAAAAPVLEPTKTTKKPKRNCKRGHAAGKAKPHRCVKAPKKRHKRGSKGKDHRRRHGRDEKKN